MKNIRIFLAAVLMALLMPLMQDPGWAEDFEVTTFEELASAVHSAKSESHIIVSNSFSFTQKGDEPQITVPAGNRVILETAGSGIVLSNENGGAMFYVEDGAELILRGRENAILTLRETDLTEEWSNSCVVSEGLFKADYVAFEGFFAETGGSVCLTDRGAVPSGNDCVMNNCQFSGNHAVLGGAVYIGTGRKAEINASSFTSNTAAEKGNDVFAAGTLVFGDNNILSSYGPLNYETDTDGSFLYAGQIYGTGSCELSERTAVSGVISWSADSAVPESVPVILLANGFERATKTITADENGYWTFTFDNLPVRDADTVIQYDIGEYSLTGFRFSKRGEADVGFELLYTANTQESLGETEDRANEQQLSEELLEVSEAVPEDSPDAVSVTKSPTDEKAEIGGQVIFISRAKNSTGIKWHLISPDGKEDYQDEEMSSVFTSLELEGLGTERLKIKVIPLSLNGWKIRAEFSGIGGPVFSEDAVITLEGADLDTTEELSESIQNLEQGDSAQTASIETGGNTSTSESAEKEPGTETVPVVDDGALMVELKKSPTNEHADLGGNAIFIARADHAQQIIWHVISPDDTVDYEDDQILKAFDGIKIEGLGTEKIKIIDIPIAMNGWKVQAEFIGEANRVLSDKASILLNNYEEIVQNEPISDSKEQNELQEEESVPDEAQIVEILPVLAEMSDNIVELTTETDGVHADTSETFQRTINVVSLWNDNADFDGKRPTMTIVELYRNDALYFTAVLNSSNNWMYSFGSLPEGNYKIKENEVQDYTVSYSVSGDTVTIIHTLSGVSEYQITQPAYTPPAVTTTPNGENSFSPVPSSNPTVQPVGTSEPIRHPGPSDIPEVINQQDYNTGESNIDDLNSSSRNSVNTMLLVGILGGAGIICAIVAIILLKKMR